MSSARPSRGARGAILVLTTLSLAALATRGALADASSVTLVYERGPGAEQCPDEPTMRAEVAARLGHDPFATGTEQRKVVAKIVREGGSLRATIDMFDAKGGKVGSRALDSKGSDCKELAAAVALTISIAIDPAAATGPVPSPSPSPAPASSPTPSASASPSPSATPVASVTAAPIASTPPPPSESGLRVSLGGHLAAGFAPRTTYGVTAALGWTTRHYSLELEGRRDVPQSLALEGVPSGAEASVSASVLLLTLVPCLRRAPVSVCALGSIGALQASGSIERPRSASSLWSSAGLRVGAEIPLGRPLILGIFGDLVAPLVRVTLRLDDRDVWSTPSLAGTVGLRLSAQF